MTKEEFFQQLKSELKSVPESERQDILADYEEHFSEAKKRGESESKICEELGTPEEIVKDLKAYAVVEKAEGNFSLTNILSVFSTVLGLGIFNLVLMIPYFGAVMILVGIAFVAAAAIIGGVGGFVALLLGFMLNIGDVMNHLGRTLLGSLFSMGGGIFLGFLDYFAIRSFYRFTIKYIKMNINLVKDND